MIMDLSKSILKCCLEDMHQWTCYYETVTHKDYLISFNTKKADKQRKSSVKVSFIIIVQFQLIIAYIKRDFFLQKTKSVLKCIDFRYLEAQIWDLRNSVNLIVDSTPQEFELKFHRFSFIRINICALALKYNRQQDYLHLTFVQCDYMIL